MRLVLCLLLVGTAYAWVPQPIQPLPLKPPMEHSIQRAMASAALILSLVFPIQQHNTICLPAVATEESILTQGGSPRPAMSALDEAWTLVDKYYIDRTFNHQDWSTIRSQYQGDDLNTVAKLIQSLGDKYTRILTPQQYTAIQKYDLIGVGVTLMPNSDKQLMVGAPPIAQSAADRAGLQAGDLVTAVNAVPTDGRTAFDIIDQIGDDPNAAQVSMTIQSNDGTTRTVTMDRAFAAVTNPISVQVLPYQKQQIAVIRIAEFNSLVKGSLQTVLEQLPKTIDAIVLDVRHNSGGAFQSAVEIAGFFVDNRVATYVVDGNHVELPFKTSQRSLVDPQIPMVLWQDGGSASASEVLAGALHDNCRAVLVGTPSFGKGLIQAVYGLQANGAGLVLTVAQYSTPRGTDIQGTGLAPDIPVGNIVWSNLIIPTELSVPKIDFQEVRERLRMCELPVEHGGTNE